MKKFATYPCIIVVFLFNLSTSCTTDGAVDFSFNWPEIIIPLPTLDSVQVTVWTKPDITFWSQWESADSLKNAETSLMFSSYSNTIEQMAYVRTTDKADTPHLFI